MLMYILIAVTGLQDPRTNPESNEKRTLQEIFYKECCSNNWLRNTLCHYYEYYYCAGACISALSAMLLRWSDDFFLLLFTILTVLTCCHGQWCHRLHSMWTFACNFRTKTMTSDCNASGHKASISVNACSHFLFLLLFSMRTHLALHIHSALLYRWEQILKPLFKTFCYLLHDCINMAFCLFVSALFSNCTGMTRWCGGVSL